MKGLAQDPNSIYNYSYNGDGEMTQDVVTYPGLSTSALVTLNYGYDQVNNRTSMSDSLGGSMSYTYDAEHNLTSESFALNGSTGAVISFAHDSLQRSNDETRSDGTGHLYDIDSTLDSTGRLTNLQYYDMTASATVANYTYAYDAGDEVTSYQDANSSLSYSYDHTSQLLSATGTLNGSNYSASWSYDANGNRNMTGYQTGTGNELLNDGTYTYTYDNNGNTATQKNLQTGSVTYYTWDYENRLTEVKVENSLGTVLNDEKFTYDVFGNQIGESLNGTQQRWTVFDGSNPYIDFDGSGTLTERYLTNPNGLNQFFGQVSGSGATEWFVTDNLGSIRQVVSTSGSVQDAITYDPYGSILSQTNAATAPRFLYAGGAYDSVTGTYLDGAREDNPVDGRWMSQDPLGLVPDSNPYRYALNNPVGWRDPTGLEAEGFTIGDDRENDIASFLTRHNQFNLDALKSLKGGKRKQWNSNYKDLLEMEDKAFRDLKGDWVIWANGPAAMNDYKQHVATLNKLNAFFKRRGINCQFRVPTLKEYVYTVLDSKIARLKQESERAFRLMVQTLAADNVFRGNEKLFEIEAELKFLQKAEVEKPGKGWKEIYEAEIEIIIKFGALRRGG